MSEQKRSSEEFQLARRLTGRARGRADQAFVSRFNARIKNYVGSRRLSL
jgi:hypothetical protein